MLDQDEATDYTDIEAVRTEVREARRVFAQHHWPVIDVTRRSIEETASSIYKLLMRRHGSEPPEFSGWPDRSRFGQRGARRAAAGGRGRISRSNPPRSTRPRSRERRGEAANPALGVAVIARPTEKACAVSRRHPDSLVIGADQMLACRRGMVRQAARSRRGRGGSFSRLRGRTHILATAVCAAQAGVPVWRATSVPELTMRRFSEEFLDAYIAAEGEALLGSVGAYRLEGRGVQLFSGSAATISRYWACR